MNALLETWSGLSIQRRVVLVVAVVATLAMTLLLARTASQPSMSLLYGGLDQQTAGEVMTALDGMNVPNEVRGNAIYVPAGEKDRVRLALAQQGLPQKSQAGYEVLENLSGFGTTSEMFQAAYWRAKEGELARTILAQPGVEAARVHIGANARSPFQRAMDAPTASVTVTMRGGAAMTENNALAARFLVALAVPGLEPAQVAVIDAQNGVVLRPGDERAAALSGLAAEKRSAQLKGDLERLLGARVGADNVAVTVSVETTTERQTISERRLDPDTQVTMSSETEGRSERSSGRSAAVTVASNLPDGDAANDAGEERSEIQETREMVEFQYSELRREQLLEPGAVKRIGVAVLINEVAETGPEGQVAWSARDDAELQAIEELVKSAIAFDPDRGDVVTIESMRFAAAPTLGTAAEPSAIDTFVSDNLGSLVQLGVLAIVVLALGLFVVRPILTARAEEAQETQAALEQVATAAALEGVSAEGGAAAAGAIPGDGVVDEALALADQSDADRLMDINVPASSTKEMELNEIVAARTEESTALLKKWLGEDEVAPRPEAA